MLGTYKDKTDAELISHAAGGNRNAFDAIVVRYSDRVCRLCYLYFKNPQEAEDAFIYYEIISGK